jgi:hypothetical protein
MLTSQLIACDWVDTRKLATRCHVEVLSFGDWLELGMLQRACPFLVRIGRHHQTVLVLPSNSIHNLWTNFNQSEMEVSPRLSVSTRT